MPHTVLFVDDEPHVTAAIRRALRKEPYRVLCVNAPADALDRLRAEPVDVLVSDEQMPGMSGSELLARVRGEHPAVIRMMLTGHATLETVLRAVNDGGIYHIFIKPCNTVELAMTLRHALQRKDLIARSRRLVQVARRQSALVQHLEDTHPGITRVARDDSGAVVIDENDTSPADLIGEINAQIERCEHLMRGQR